MFRKTRFKLTAWYLLIIMAVSLALSVFIYKVQVREIERLERVFRIRQEQSFREFRNTRPLPPFAQDPEVLEDARQRIIMFLVLVNGAIFVIAGGLGYFLAGRTLKPIQEMLDEQNRFISDASHELKTPLTSLKSAFEVYLRNKKPTLKKANILVKESLLETNKLQTLAESLLLLAQYKKLNSHVESKPVSIEKVINEAIQRMKSKANSAGVKLKTNITPFEVSGDKDKLADLLVILVDNAIKYSKRESVVYITSVVEDGKGQMIVKDKGIGINKKDLPHIFDRFYRADASRSKSKIDGYGLGLAIAKEITNEHKGNLSVSSRFGRGSIFTVTFPASAVLQS